MFLCSKCHDPECVHFSGSHGRCEGCGKTADCVDCHAYKRKPKAKPKVKVSLDKNGRPMRRRPARPENLASRYHPSSEAEKLLLKDFGGEDHTECNHGVGHCQYSTMFEVLFKAERQRQYEAKRNAVCDGCGRKGGDIQSCGKDANGDPDAPDLCFLCRKKAEREFGYRRARR